MIDIPQNKEILINPQFVNNSLVEMHISFDFKAYEQSTQEKLA